jgi:hypothetical protein
LQDADRLKAMLRPFPAEAMSATVVSTWVNNARNEGALGVDMKELFPRFSQQQPLFSSVNKMLDGQVKSVMSPDDILSAESKRLTASMKYFDGEKPIVPAKGID